MEALSYEISEKQSHSLSFQTNDTFYLKGVSLRVQDLTDNL